MNRMDAQSWVTLPVSSKYNKPILFMSSDPWTRSGYTSCVFLGKQTSTIYEFRSLDKVRLHFLCLFGNKKEGGFSSHVVSQSHAKDSGFDSHRPHNRQAWWHSTVTLLLGDKDMQGWASVLFKRMQRSCVLFRSL